VSDARIKIKLLDVNDNSPIFAERKYEASVAEDAEAETRVLAVLATDDDDGQNGKVTYELIGEGADVFSIDPEEGVITVIRV